MAADRPQGYYRFPTIHNDRIVYVCEDDLWTVNAEGGVARRLTSGLGEASHPRLSPKGDRIAFTGRDSGYPEVFVMPADGGEATAITDFAGYTTPIGWSGDGRQVIVASEANQPFRGLFHLYRVPARGGPPQPIRVGPARSLATAPGGKAQVLGRNTRSLARWKRYRGGTAGSIWVDRSGNGSFERILTELGGNLGSPMWIGKRIFFLADHEGHANIYSCTPSGKNVRRHTDHEELYARDASTDGRRIVYHRGADLWVFDPKTDATHRVGVEHLSPRTQRDTKFVTGASYLSNYDLHPDGRGLAVTVRGRSARFACWEGAVSVFQQQPSARHRLTRHLRDGERLVTISDEGGEEGLWIVGPGGAHTAVKTRKNLGRALAMEVAPAGTDRVAITNHRYELWVVNLKTAAARKVDASRHGRINGFEWSPDGRWLAYSLQTGPRVAVIKLWRASTGRSTEVTRRDFTDVRPSFDPKGRYLYFLSYREFDPVYDNIVFDLNFPCGVRPFLVTLRKDVKNPLVARPRSLHSDKEDEEDGDKDEKPDNRKKRKKGAKRAAGKRAKSKAKNSKSSKKKAKDPKPIEIDLDGIEDRVLGLPVPDGRYTDIRGLESKVLLVEYPIEGTLQGRGHSEGRLDAWNLKERRLDPLIESLHEIRLSGDRKTLCYRYGRRLRVLKAGDKPREDGSEKSRATGWIDLRRVKVPITPGVEWRQMYREAWRLQREHFWTKDMSGVDWKAIYLRYLPLIDRVSSRSEFSDLLWEMQGELGTSHAYELGGDYRSTRWYRQGSLGADLGYDPKRKAWKIERIPRGDTWDPSVRSPLAEPGLDVREGDVIVSVAGRKVDRLNSPDGQLLNVWGDPVEIEVRRGRTRARTVTVQTLRDDRALRYRDWVERNRALVHEKSKGRAGYVHIPDMSPRGFAEFHRYYLAELDREGLVIDIRWNGGGHVSQLLLEKLLRKRVGYDFSRWGEAEPYPLDSPRGPLVALTNEYAGSDGDIFSHCFKLYGLGPLIGTRTWGGVIGIWPRHALVDGTVTTQPEFSFWFEDVGWGVENYGTDPDIVVDNTPEDYRKGRDRQLEMGLKEIRRLLKERPPTKPKVTERPNLAPPRLPKRNK
ncbi:MAG: S41 family peptidase [Planctomycetota bacterium]|jgi:tricorn protease